MATLSRDQIVQSINGHHQQQKPRFYDVAIKILYVE